jgi:hypothetical protein
MKLAIDNFWEEVNNKRLKNVLQLDEILVQTKMSMANVEIRKLFIN